MDILYKCGHCYFHSAREVGIREHPKRGTGLPLWRNTASMTDLVSVAIGELRGKFCHTIVKSPANWQRKGLAQDLLQ